MNGIGWVCDECGKTEVIAEDAFHMDGSRNGSLPDGWYLLFKAQPIRAALNERWEFCSVECIHAQTAPKLSPAAEAACGVLGGSGSLQQMDDPYKAGRS